MSTQPRMDGETRLLLLASGVFVVVVVAVMTLWIFNV